MKKFLLGLFTVIIFASTIVYASIYIAEDASFKVFVGGKEFTDGKAVVIDGSAYLPLRSIGKVLGTDVKWNDALHRVEIDGNPGRSGENKFSITSPALPGSDMYNQSGDTADNAKLESNENKTYDRTETIEVKAGKKYTVPYKYGYVSWYKEDGTFLEETDFPDSEGCVTAPNDAKYAKFVYLSNGNENFDSVQIQTPAEYTEDDGSIRFVSYGDSIVEQNKWQPFLIDSFGFSHTNLGISSTTVAYVESREDEYPCMVNSDRIEAIKAADPDLIVIMGGTNDAHLGIPFGDEIQLSEAPEDKDKTTFYGAYSFLIESLLEWKPTLHIVLMTPMSHDSRWNVPYYDDYAEAVRKIGEYFAIPVADTNREGRISRFDASTFTEDGLHPNIEGGRIIANVVASKIVSLFE